MVAAMEETAGSAGDRIEAWPPIFQSRCEADSLRSACGFALPGYEKRPWLTPGRFMRVAQTAGLPVL